MTLKDQIFAWVDQIAASPHPGWWLFLLAVAEASFFPVPPDVLLISLGVATPERALWYGLVCSTGSVLGGALGYGIGLYGGRPLLLRVFKHDKVAAVERLYDRYNAWATGIAGLTPIPYKVFTIAGGAFKITFKVFMLASLVSRSLRFMVEAVLLYFYGSLIRDFLYTRFNRLSVAFVVLLVAGFWLVHRLGRRAGRTRRSRRMNESAVVHRYRVEGLVQGVGFRAFVWRLAGELAVSGWVRNRRDGSVEVLASATEAVHEQLLGGLREGPRLSRVERVVLIPVEDGDPGAGFSIRYDG